MEEKYFDTYLQEQGRYLKLYKLLRNQTYESLYKIWERIIECKLWQETTTLENQFGIMSGQSTKEVIFLLRHLMKKI